MPTANFEGFAFRLSGPPVALGGSIPVGTTLDKVILTTRDLLTETGTKGGGSQDAFGLVSGESATIQINGSVIATTLPTLRGATLTTDAGTLSVFLFTVGADTYAIARAGTDFDAHTQITAPSVTSSFAFQSSLNPITYGLLPEGASTFTAATFNTQSSGANPNGQSISITIGTTTVYDTDLERGNGELTGGGGTELLTTLQFSDGSILGGVEALRYGGYSGYVTSFSYLFNAEKLNAVGKTLADVTGVLNSFAFDHDLDWDDVGFTLAAGPLPDGGNNDVPPPPPPPPPLVRLDGTSRADRLTGTDAAEAIRGFDGNDRLTGRGGADVFVFGTESRSGVRSTDTITDYQAGIDAIALEGGASVQSITDSGTAIIITLVGDRDRIVVQGADLDVADIDIVSTSGSFLVL